MPKTDPSIVQALIDQLRPALGQNGEVAFFEQLAIRLYLTAHQDTPWGWRYIQSVAHGTLEPSRKFMAAVQLLASEMDGLPAFIAETEPVTVHARPETVQKNSIVLGSSRICANPGCT